MEVLHVFRHLSSCLFEKKNPEFQLVYLLQGQTRKRNGELFQNLRRSSLNKELGQISLIINDHHRISYESLIYPKMVF